MKAIFFDEHGDLDKLQYGDFPEPKLKPGHIIVQVKACALNYLDIFARLGGLETELALPHIGGADIAGVVAEIGPGTTDLSVGDRVLVNPRIRCTRCENCLKGEHSLCDEYTVIGWHMHGGFAEYMIAPFGNIRPFSESLSFEQAASIPLAFTTAWRMLISRARLEPGEDVLVLGASGGVATAALQIAKLAGARVIAVTSTESKLQKLKQLGADEVINYHNTDFDRATLDITNGRGVDIVFQTLAGDTWQKGLASAAKGGRVVVCAGILGASPKEDLETIWWKQLQIIGSTGATAADFNKVIDLLDAGKFTPVIDSAIPLSDAKTAQTRMIDHKHFGKIVLVP